MKHLNGNLLGCVDVETTGFKAGFNDIIEVCVVILDNQLNPAADIMPFVLELQPKRPENISLEALRIQGKNLDDVIKRKACKSRHRVVEIATKGCDADIAADMFHEWFQNLKLAPFKKILPIACNWAFDRTFLVDWLGDEAFFNYFSPQYRDIMSMALFENDVADWRGINFPYQKANLGYLCKQLGITRDGAHSAVDDVHDTIKCYKRLISNSH